MSRGRLAAVAVFLFFSSLAFAASHSFNSSATVNLSVGDSVKIGNYFFVYQDFSTASNSISFDVSGPKGVVCKAYSSLCTLFANRSTNYSQSFAKTTGINVSFLGFSSPGVAVVSFYKREVLQQTKCPLFSCAIYCPQGFANDSTGCPTCRCRTPLPGVFYDISTCQVFGTCGGGVPRECSLPGAELYADKCTKKDNLGTSYSCRKSWRTPCLSPKDSKIHCPGGKRLKVFTTGCKAGQVRAICVSKYETECSAKPSCKPGYAKIKASSCTYSLQSTSYCCPKPVFNSSIYVETSKNNFVQPEQIKIN